MRQSLLALSIAAWGLAACSGVDATVEGTVADHALVPANAFMIGSKFLEGDSIKVVISDNELECDKLAREMAIPKGATTLTMWLFDGSSGKPGYPIGPGDYTVVAEGAPLTDQKIAIARFEKRGADNCDNSLPAGVGKVLSGKISITSEQLLLQQPATGTFDLSLANGDLLRGTFAVKTCDGDPNATLTCQ